MLGMSLLDSYTTGYLHRHVEQRSLFVAHLPPSLTSPLALVPRPYLPPLPTVPLIYTPS
jgi:hypothetical protein